MEKPASVFDRDREWGDLARFVGQQQPGATLGVVYGRRRQGKTYLLDAMCQATGGFYFGATEATETESLNRLGAELGRHRGLSTPIALADWHQAVDALLDLGLDTPVPVVLDEFPYLVQATPALPSIIQHAYGPRRSQRTRSRTRLLLCGSALSFMGRLLTGNAPLRGRAGLEMVVQTLDYRLAAEFWNITDPRLAMLLHSVVGGTPAYRREFVHDDIPAGLDDFDPWVVRNALEPSSPLFREARHLLAEEPGLRDAALYHSVLGAVASGNRTRGGIASAVGRKVNDLSHPITVLEDTGLLYREEDAFRQGRTRYTVAEPLVTFYHAVMRPQWSRLGRLGQAERVWSESKDRFLGSVVGPHFESLCREWTAYYAASETLGGSPARVTAGVVTDSGRRRTYEIDVAAFGVEPGSRRQLLAIGEAKWGETLGVEHLERLSHVREVLRRRDDIDATGTRLVLFAGAGFTDDLQNRARSDGDVVLVDLERLYSGE